MKKTMWLEAVRHISRDTTFVLFSLAVLLTSTVFMQAFSTLPMYLSGLHYSKNQIGWLLATNGTLIVFCQIPVTWLLHRFNRILVILAGELLIAMGFGLTTVALAWPVVLTTIVIWTLGEVIQAAFKQSLVADFSPPDMRGRYMGVFGLCHAVGMMFGAPIGGWILEHRGGHVLWPVCCCCSLGACCIYWQLYRRLKIQPVPTTG